MRHLLFLLLLTASADCIAQRPPVKLLGTVTLNDTTAMKATEVSVLEWMDFIVANNYDTGLFPTVLSTSLKILFDELRTKQFRYVKLVKRTDYQQREFGKWQVVLTKTSRKLIDSDSNYLSLNIPATGISYEQAMAFCRWKAHQVNSTRPENKKVMVQLPSKEIYRQFIENIDSLCTGKCNECNKYLLNYKVPACPVSRDKSILTQGRGVIRADAYWPSKKGFYNLQGNAAEMTSAKGTAMGGSYDTTARESYNDRTQSYDKPEVWLGFRYIVLLAHP